jgi:thymidylate kinase
VIEAERAGTRCNDACEPTQTLPAVRALFDAFAAHHIACCLWKSNQHLDAALAGLTDLDLLVAGAHAAEFRSVLARHDVKALVAPPYMTYPGTEHYLGFDASTGRLFHVHAQYQLVLGEKYVKNYRVPFERPLLASVRKLRGVPVPQPELELALLSTRVLFKYRLRDVVKDVLGVRTPGVTAEQRAELAWLLDQTTVDDVRGALYELGGGLPPDTICSFLHTVVRTPRAGLRFIALRTRLRRELRCHRRHRRAVAFGTYLRGGWKRRRRLRRRDGGTKLALATGGTTIGLVGADGAGKSTTAEVISMWLGWKLDTGSYYMGSKEPSRTSRGLYLVFRVLRRGHRCVSARIGPDVVTTVFLAATRDTVLALHHLAIGRDRARRHRRARHDADAGRVVVFDRFPLEALRSADADRLLDGPQIATSVDRRNRLLDTLSAAEERMYRQFGLPDQLVALHVSPDVAKARKPDHERDILDLKSRALVGMARAARRNGTRVHDVDANRPLESVLLDVKSEVWHAL